MISISAPSAAIGRVYNGQMKFPAENSNRNAFVPWTEEWYELKKRLLGEAACRQLGLYVIPADLMLSVVVPFFNEQETLETLIKKVVEIPIQKQIILVDDGSTDDSHSIALALIESLSEDDQNKIQLVVHGSNCGKGAALKTGFAHATGDIVIIQDADLEYDPNDYPKLVQPIIEQKADVVFGSRFLGDHPHRASYFWHKAGNRFLTTLSNMFTNLNLTDIETCYKVFRREVTDEIGPLIRSKRFGVEPELTARIARRKYRVFETSISYNGRTYSEGKKISWRDGFEAIYCIVRYGLAD